MGFFKNDEQTLGFFDIEKKSETDLGTASSNHQADAALLAAKGNLEKRRGPGRPPKNPPAPTDNAPRVNAASADLAKLFDPAVWTPLVRLPADAMCALTGREFWNLQDKEAAALGTSAASAAQYVGIENPKSLAISLFLVSALVVYGPRALKELDARRAERAEAVKPK